ncbi:E3 ubiquitin-protein ligase PUB23-like [Rhodamnia argentea]|uniref:U-box domain-containing protein n=1 Tax=Rhodamnia argentea TaxID=178133 RepID=A0A8B8NEX4_9MYRT|nr:E3 ubiquitin-protein ligase PUB23-like [Rhodamnia argentea]
MCASMEDGDHGGDGIDVPTHFLCPISLQLMADPVTASTGITYDRDSIERWLFTCKSSTCPVTKQQLGSGADLLTPNHTLRRLIQAWCTLNSFDRIPTPKPPLDKAAIVKLLDDAKKSTRARLTCLQRLRSIALGGDDGARNRKCLDQASSGVLEFLASIIKNDESTLIVVSGSSDGTELARASDEALNILCHLNVAGSDLKRLMINDDLTGSLMRVLRSGSYQSRAYTTMILKSAYEAADPIQLMSVGPQFFAELVRVLKDQISQQASKAALKLMVELCPWGRNRIKAVEGGAVPALVELLLDTNGASSADSKRACELILTVLDQLCGSAEGRAELVAHAAGLAVVAKKVLRVSHAASDRAVRILASVSRFSASARVLQEMLQVGAVTKLCLVLQVDGGSRTTERARDILRLHARVWRSSPCIPPPLLRSYPTPSS